MAAKTVFHLVQYERNPKTGEDLHFNENNIILGLSHASIKEWAYVRHDKDKITEKDEANGLGKVGEERPAHWHLIGHCSYFVEPNVLAKWFGVPANQIDLPKGRNAFLDCVKYLTHEDAKQQEQGKYRYPDEEIKTSPNFNFRERLEKLEENRLKYGSDLSKRDKLRYDVLYNGLTLRQAVRKDQYNYMQDCDKLCKLRRQYLLSQKPPKTRINYYVCGEGGEGKSLISRAIARSLYPDIEDDDDIFFIIGGTNVSFDGYDGQPVIIWDDKRAADLLRCLGGRDNVFNVFDTHPQNQRQHIKYGYINLCNQVNIVNSVEPYIQFLNGLSGEYTDRIGMEHKAEDKKQAYRRFPLIIPVHQEDFDILVNRGFLGEMNRYMDFIEYKHIVGSMKKLGELYARDEETAKTIEYKTVKPIIDKHKEIIDIDYTKDSDDLQILEEFKNYGTMQGEVLETHYEDPPAPKPSIVSDECFEDLLHKDWKK